MAPNQQVRDWGAKLRRLREQKVLSQRDLAAKCGVTQATIANIELGKTKPHPSTLRKLAHGLGISAEDLADALK